MEKVFAIIVMLAVMAGMFWLFLVVLKGLFRATKAAIGWIGPIMISAIPGAATWFITNSLFGHGTEMASAAGITTAVIIGVVGNMTGTDVS